jgi:hypothetical protein
VECDLQEEVGINEENLVETNGPVSLFKIINEIFEMTGNLIKLKEVGIVLCKYTHTMIGFYQNELADKIEMNEIAVPHYMAICNNTNLFNLQIKSLESRL